MKGVLRYRVSPRSITDIVLGQVFDTVDFFESKKRWFGSLLGDPNRHLIFSAGQGVINKWFDELLFSGKAASDAFNTCLTTLKIKGASKGLATLVLYLSSRKSITFRSTKRRRDLSFWIASAISRAASGGELLFLRSRGR